MVSARALVNLSPMVSSLAKMESNPAHGFQGGLAGFPDEDGCLLARGEIVTRSFRTGTFGDNKPNEFFQLIQIGGDGVAAAHRNYNKLLFWDTHQIETAMSVKQTIDPEEHPSID